MIELVEDFRYGLNVVDSEADLPAGATRFQQSCSVDELGLLGKRGGGARLVAGLSADAYYVFYSAQLDKFFVQVGLTLKKYGSAWTFEADVLTLPTLDKVAIVDFNSTSGANIVLVHKTGGIYDSPDGVTWTNRSATVKGTTIAVWHNKLWVGGADGPRVWWSNAGTSAVYSTATDFVDVREKDVTTISALHETAGVLLAFKANSAYRINNAADGSYVMIDRAHGAAEHESVASVEGLTGCASPAGFFTTDGNSALIERSAPVRPFFARTTGIAYVVTTLRRRFIIGLTRKTFNTATAPCLLEWDPGAGLELGGGWWFHNSVITSGPRSWGGQVGDALIFLSRREVWSFGDPALGDENGVAIDFQYELGPLRLGATDKVRIRRAIIEGRAPTTLDLYLRRDYDTTDDPVRALTVLKTATREVVPAEVHSLGVCRTLSMRFANSSTDSLLDDRGSVSVYRPPVAIARVRLDYILLGRA